MRTVFLSLFILVAVNSVVGQECIPGDGEAALFQYAGFDGKCVVLGPGQYANCTAMRFDTDSASSVRVGPGAQVLLCQHAGYEGRCEVLTADDENLSGNYVRDNAVSSVKVEALGGTFSCDPGPAEVAFYFDRDFSGPCSTRGIGDYPRSRGIGLRNDTVTSVKVGSEVQVALCQHANYNGNCQTLQADDSDLTNNRIGKISSARVEPRGTSHCPIGPDEVAVFQHRNYEAPCKVLGPGNYPRSHYFAPVPNDSMSSIRVGSNAQALICRHAFYDARCTLVTDDVSDLRSTDVGNDAVSSMKVQARGFDPCPIDAGKAVFYRHPRYTQPCVALGIGRYDEITTSEVPDYSISSIAVGSDVQVCACTGREMTGRCRLFTSNAPTLGNFEDLTRSAEVAPVGSSCTPAGETPPSGYSAVWVANCLDRPVHVWIRDLSVGGPWDEKEELPTRGSQACADNMKVYPLPDRHYYHVTIVDPGALLCTGENNPDGSRSCVPAEAILFGDPKGVPWMMQSY